MSRREDEAGRGGAGADAASTSASSLASEGQTLLRAAYLLSRRLLGPLAAQAENAHHVHRLRVFQATLSSWLEEHEGAWLGELRDADMALHEAQLGGGDEELGRLIAGDEGRVRDALRAADRLTFRRREVDLHGASLLTGLGRDELRRAIERGQLVAREDGRGPLLSLEALAAFAEARGLQWDDGLEDPGAGARHEGRLRQLLGG